MQVGTVKTRKTQTNSNQSTSQPISRNSETELKNTSRPKHLMFCVTPIKMYVESIHDQPSRHLPNPRSISSRQVIVHAFVMGIFSPQTPPIVEMVPQNAASLTVSHSIVLGLPAFYGITAIGTVLSHNAYPSMSSFVDRAHESALLRFSCCTKGQIRAF